MNTDEEVKLCHKEIVEVLQKYNLPVFNSLGILSYIIFSINKKLNNDAGINRS